MRFETTVELGGKTATGMEVPDDVVEALGGGKRPPVTVTVGGHTYRTTVAVMGGRYLVPLSAENRTAAGVAAGDTVEVGIELDTAERRVEIPVDLAEALAEVPEAKAFFESLSYSKQQWHTLQVSSAKKPETRANRVATSVAMLAAGRAR